MWQARAAILPIILFCIGLNDKSPRGAERARLVEFCTLSVKNFAKRALFPFRPTVGRWPCPCAFLRGEGWLCIAAGGRGWRVAGIRACGKRRKGKAAGCGLALAFARWCGKGMACGFVRDAPVRFFLIAGSSVLYGGGGTCGMRKRAEPVCLIKRGTGSARFYQGVLRFTFGRCAICRSWVSRGRGRWATCPHPVRRRRCLHHASKRRGATPCRGAVPVPTCVCRS